MNIKNKITNLLSIFINFVLTKFDNLMEYIDRKRIILDRASNQKYLIRYYIFLKDRDNKFPFNIFIHKFLKSDEPVIHDHPWGYYTLILYGGYWEHLIDNNDISKTVKHWRYPGFFQNVNENHKHFIELEKDKNGIEKTCWTLFIPGIKYNNNWGFYPKFNNFEWIDSNDYLKEKNN